MKKVNFSLLSIIIVIGLLPVNTYAITDALKIKIAKGSYSDETVIRFIAGATNGFDASYDSWKLFSSNQSVPNIFTKDSLSNNLAVNAMPSFNKSVLKEFFLRIGTAGTYSITVTEPGAFASGVRIMMKDKLTNQLYNLRTAGTFTISLPVIAQSDSARFQVLFSYPAVIQTVNSSCSTCNDGAVTISKTGENKWYYSIKNSAGVILLADSSLNVSKELAGFVAGNYTVTITGVFLNSETRPFTVSGPPTYYSRKDGNWSDKTAGNGIWSLVSSTGASCDCTPVPGSVVIISFAQTVSLDVDAVCGDVQISNMATLNGTANLTVTRNITTSGSGKFSPSAGSWEIHGNVILSGSGNSSSPMNDTMVVHGNMVLNTSTTLTIKAPFALKGDLSVDGTLATGTNFFILNGTAAQSINGTKPITLYQLVIDNSSLPGVTLNRPITVSRTLSLLDGILYSSGANLLSLSAGSVVSNVSGNSFVSGPVAKSGNTDFSFPIGKNFRYRPASISNLSGNETFTAEYFSEDPDPIYSTEQKDEHLDSISRCEYWIISRVGTENALVQLSSDSLSCINSNESPVIVTFWDGAAWRSNGVTRNSAVQNKGASDPVEALSLFDGPFTLATTDPVQALAATFIGFSATRNNNEVALTWITGSENNSDYFTVERSTDGIAYEPVHAIIAAGNSSSTLTYRCKDLVSFQGVLFYRVKLTDLNGSVSYSETVSVSRTSNIAGINVFPIPASETFFVSIEKDTDSGTTITIRDITGKEVYSQTTALTHNHEIIPIAVPPVLKSGFYMLSVIAGNQLFEQTIIIH